MTRSELIVSLTPVVRAALKNAEEEIVRIARFAGPVVRPVLDSLIDHATPLITRIVVECAVARLGPIIVPYLNQAEELFGRAGVAPGMTEMAGRPVPGGPAAVLDEPFHPAVLGALREQGVW